MWSRRSLVEEPVYTLSIARYGCFQSHIGFFQHVFFQFCVALIMSASPRSLKPFHLVTAHQTLSCSEHASTVWMCRTNGAGSLPAELQATDTSCSLCFQPLTMAINQRHYSTVANRAWRHSRTDINNPKSNTLHLCSHQGRAASVDLFSRQYFFVWRQKSGAVCCMKLWIMPLGN